VSIALLVITDKAGQRECLDRTLRSLGAAWRGPEPDQVVVVNDAGDPAYDAWVRARFGPWPATVISHPERRGFAAAIATGWEAVAGAQWVVHVEDDFVFKEAFPLPEMIELLTLHPHLAQVSLLRQAVNATEVAAGGLVEAHPGEFVDREVIGAHSRVLRWMEQALYFTTNPCVYPGALVHLGWPQEPHSEGLFTHRLRERGFGAVAGPDVRFGVWGATTDAPRVLHIGRRQGTGY
jgi:hypothetical protein